MSVGNIWNNLGPPLPNRLGHFIVIGFSFQQGNRSSFVIHLTSLGVFGCTDFDTIRVRQTLLLCHNSITIVFHRGSDIGGRANKANKVRVGRGPCKPPAQIHREPYASLFCEISSGLMRIHPLFKVTCSGELLSCRKNPVLTFVDPEHGRILAVKMLTSLQHFAPLVLTISCRPYGPTS